MPKAAPYRLSWNLKQGIYTVHDTRSQEMLSVAPDSHAWFDWLASIASFTFNGQHGQCTVRQETRSGGIYWYAYRRVEEKMAKKYLGQTNALTLARLEEIAHQFRRPALSPAEHETSPLSDRALTFSGNPSTPPVAMHDLLLTSQLAVPRLRTKLVHRARLLTDLEQGIETTLTLVSAPAGSGKTTLLTQWLAESPLPFTWVSLTQEDNDPVHFLSAVLAALQRLNPHLGSSASAFLHSSSPSPSPETVVALLVRDLYQQAPLDVVLVLDDYQVITAEVLHRVMTFLVNHAPPHLHLVIATRADPSLPLAKLRASGQLCEVRAIQLQFLPEETSSFLHSVMGLDLSAEECAMLQSRTEGWIAGLQLAGLSLQERSDKQQFLINFTGSHRHIVDYLVEEVLSRQPEEVRTFLLRTSILDRLTGPLCDAVTGRTRSDVLIEQLERANLFLIPLDERQQWYRYHHLFAQVLRVYLQREVSTEELAALYTRASAWFEQNTLPAEAIEAALSASDFRRAARLIDEPLASSMLLSLQYATLIRWLECFPKELLFTNALLCLMYAYSLFFSQTPQAHEGPLAVAEYLFQAEDNRIGLGQVYMLRAIAASEGGDGVQAIRYGTQVFQLVPENAMIERSTAASALAEGYRLEGDVVAARRVLAKARPLREQSGNLSSILGDSIALGDLLVMQGKLHEAANIYDSVLRSAGERQGFAVSALIGLGNIARERSELERAEAHLGEAISIASTIRARAHLARASLMHARVIQARGDGERTREAWDSTLLLAQECGYTGIVEQVQAYQVRSWLQQRCMDDVIRWQQASPFAHDASPTFQREVRALTHVRLLLAQGEGGEALQMLERWHQYARTQGRTGSEIEMLVLSAQAYQTQGKREQAVQLLQQALLLASPEGYVRVFLDEGTPIAALLSLVQSSWKGRTGANDVSRLLSVWQAEQLAHDFFSPAASQGEPPIKPLSSHERKVLRLLTSGLSNAEIAAELVVSVNTIRTQTRSIYQKLNVKNRHEARAIAQSWRLL